METPDVQIKPEPADSGSFLSSLCPQDKNKKRAQTVATIDVSSDEEDAMPTPKTNRFFFSLLLEV